jgi:tol-pal system protein YbgF
LPGVPVVSETLPVAPLPEQRAGSQLRSAAVAVAPAADSGGGEAELTRYRTGLRLLRERHFAEAAAAFGAFLEAHPSHELAASALYWRGEANYARRDYVAARAEFEALLTRFPRADKAADALLKLALCFRQLGAEDKAKDALRRLRADYPNSQAASTAAREGST